MRKSIIQSLKGTSMVFSDVMRGCGLDPNHDTGPFLYHLSILSEAGIVEKKRSKYRLTSFGDTIATFIDSVGREGTFLLKAEKPDRGDETRMGRIEAKWLTQPEAQHGEYGILLGGPSKTPLGPEEVPSTSPEDRPKHKELRALTESLPRLEMPPAVFPGHVLGFEKSGVKLGSIQVHLCTGNEVGTRKVIAIARVLSIWVVDQDCQEIRETRASVLRQMMEEFTRQVKEHHVQTIVIERANADDEDLISLLKGLGYERYMTTYLMRTTIPQ
jgi:hypothetical protein